MREILGKKFFDRPALEVAPELIGKYIVRSIGGAEQAYMITEVEAYIGPEDLASHSSRGMTERNRVMFGEPGIWYVYLCYGIHWLANIVTGPGMHPSAVLLRGVEGAQGRIDGPGKLTRILGIDAAFNGQRVDTESEKYSPCQLWLESRGALLEPKNIRRMPRIGVGYAGAWAKKPYRFVLK